LGRGKLCGKNRKIGSKGWAKEKRYTFSDVPISEKSYREGHDERRIFPLKIEA